MFMSIRISEHIREACAGIRRMQMMTRRESKRSEHTKSCKKGIIEMKQNGRIKNLIAALLCLLVMGLCAAAGAADSGTCGDSLTWTLDDDELLTISGTGEMTSSPWDQDAVKTITIGDGVTSIGEGAFSGCSFTSITIPKSVTGFGDIPFVSVFEGCSSLTSVNISTDHPTYCSVDGVVFNKNKTALIFYPAGRSGSYSIPESVTSIGEFAFSGCSGLTGIAIPDGVTSIGDCAFFECTGLKSARLSVNISNLGESAFDKATTLIVPEGSYAAEWAEEYELKYETYDPTPKSIVMTTDGHGTASADPSSGVEGTEVTLAATPDEGYQFKEWQVVSGGVTVTNNKFTIGTSDIEIKAIFEPITYTVTITDDGNGKASASPSSGVKGTEVTLAATPGEGYQFKEWQVVSGGVTVTGSKFTIGTSDVEVKAIFEEVTVPPAVYSVTVTTDGHGTASASPSSGVKGTEVTLAATPNEGYQFKEWQVVSGGVTITGSKFTVGTSDVEIKAIFEEVEVPPAVYSVSVTTDGHGTASARPSSGTEGTEVALAAKPKKGYKFKEWVVVSGGVVIENDRFTIGSSNVEVKAVFAALSKGDSFVSGGMKYQILTDKTVSFLGLDKAKSETSVSIPARVTFGGKSYKVTEIAAKALYKDTKVITVTIGQYVETIGKSAFYGAKVLTTVKGGKEVTSIGNSAFASCVKLKDFPVLGNLKTIGANALKGCKALTKFTIGQNVVKIGNGAFNGCTKLKKWTVKSAKLKAKSVGADAFKNIGKKASFECPSKKLAKSYETIFRKAGAPKSAKFTTK